MDYATILGIYAQMAVVIVGLSGIVTVLGHRATGKWDIADYTRFWTMIAATFAVLLFSLLPIVLYFFGLGLPDVWFYSSLIGVIAISALIIWRFRNYPKAHADPHLRVRWWWFVTVLQFLSAGIFFLNALGLRVKDAFAPYLLAVTVVLAVSCITFVRLLISAMYRE